MSDRPAPSLLAAYFDLHTDRGPLHARATADLGRRYLAREMLPPYQVITPGGFRRTLSPGAPGAVYSPGPLDRSGAAYSPRSLDRSGAAYSPRSAEDPRQLPAAHRSAEWACLCRELDHWSSLDVDRQLSVARVLGRLGFWSTVDALPTPATAPMTVEHLKLSYWRCVARQIASGPDPRIAAGARALLVALARSTRFPAAARLSAAINLVVDHARSDRSMAEMLRWQGLARSLIDAAPSNNFSILLLSAYWRAVSFIPFHRSDHAEVRRMLDESERLAHRAVGEAGDDRYLLALENVRLVLMTRGRASAAAGDRVSAEGYFRTLVGHDPLDAMSHVLLADFLAAQGRS
ncbi:hypothetical protein ACWF94_28505, partial [Streptomyces sp. NPDC055078]